jgi:hypothetical protein
MVLDGEGDEEAVPLFLDTLLPGGKEPSAAQQPPSHPSYHLDDHHYKKLVQSSLACWQPDSVSSFPGRVALCDWVSRALQACEPTPHQTINHDLSAVCFISRPTSLHSYHAWCMRQVSPSLHHAALVEAVQSNTHILQRLHHRLRFLNENLSAFAAEFPTEEGAAKYRFEEVIPCLASPLGHHWALRLAARLVCFGGGIASVAGLCWEGFTHQEKCRLIILRLCCGFRR